ncbi:MAG: trypsin-like peptidase domain-containing protein, partial [Verrucomicrobiota bacterium]|nr:trypsin-like peptidase domain-containing protein [Verrucomicrobiota bacterium]
MFRRSSLQAKAALIAAVWTLSSLLQAAYGAVPETTPLPDSPADSPAESSAKATPVPSTPTETPSRAVENAVVKVFSTLRFPDLYKPWTKQGPHEISGSGVVIDGKRILTNAHVVLYASQVQVQANQAGDKLSATVEAIAPGIDLAVLKLDDEKFFDSHPPLARAKTYPEIKEAVMAYG